MNFGHRLFGWLVLGLLSLPQPASGGRIHELALRGNAAEIGKLLAASPELVHERDSSGFTALHHAAAQGHLDVVVLLLNKGADLNAAPENGIEAGKTPLVSAISLGRTNVAVALIGRGADLTGRYRHVVYGGGLTLLHAAALAQDAKVMKLLLDKGVDPNLVDSSGRTPLLLLLRAGRGRLNDRISRPLAALLINGKADVNLADDQGVAPLHAAVQLDFFDTALLLVQSGAEVNATTKDMNTPLKIAMKLGNAKMIKMLKDNGATD